MLVGIARYILYFHSSSYLLLIISFFTNNSFDELLDELATQHKGKMFIMDTEGELVASSTYTSIIFLIIF